jgi:hypothetical protein
VTRPTKSVIRRPATDPSRLWSPKSYEGTISRGPTCKKHPLQHHVKPMRAVRTLARRTARRCAVRDHPGPATDEQVARALRCDRRLETAIAVSSASEPI